MPHVITTGMVKQMRELRSKRKTLKEICKAVGVSEHTARKYTRDLGINLSSEGPKRRAL